MSERSRVANFFLFSLKSKYVKIKKSFKNNTAQTYAGEEIWAGGVSERSRGAIFNVVVVEEFLLKSKIEEVKIQK